jgi:hypothetical protein
MIEAGKPLPSLVNEMIKDGLVSLGFADGSVYVARNTVDGEALRPFILCDTGAIRNFEVLKK